MPNPPKQIDTWKTFWMSMAYFVAMKSKDPSTKVGCVIVGEGNNLLSIGYNGPPRGMDDRKPGNYTRPRKYLIFEHAERNAIYNSARHGIRLKGSVLHITWLPCADCARAVVQTGIERVIIHKQGVDALRMSREGQDIHSWEESCQTALDILNDCSVPYHWYDGPIVHRTFATFSGKHYQFCGPGDSPIECGCECAGTDKDQATCALCTFERDDN